MQPVEHAPLKFPDLAALYESVLSLQLHEADRDISFSGVGAYTHSDSWRELDDKIVTASAKGWLASTKTENKERTLKRNFSVSGIAVICLSAKTRMRRLVPLSVCLIEGKLVSLAYQTEKASLAPNQSNTNPLIPKSTKAN